MTSKWSLATAPVAGALTFALYMVGAGRNYDYDSSQTVGTFIATPSLLDPFRRQTVFNNHPLFSFLEHVVYSAGGHSAAALRVLPVVFAAATVGLVTGWAARRWGMLAGLCAGALLAVNPLFAFYSRAVRGYSLVTLSAVASTILLVRLLRSEGRWIGVAYVFVAAAGVATHLYALLPLGAQAAAVAARGAFNRLWAIRFAAALVLGGLAYVDIGARMVRSAEREAHRFRPHFPLTLARTVLGSTSATAVLIGVLVALGLVTLLRREIVAAASLLAAVTALLWLWLEPVDLYARFFVWLVAGVALLAGAAVARVPLAASVVVAAVVVLVLADVRHWTQNPLPDRQAAQLVAEVREQGRQPCVLPLVRGSLVAYTRAPREVTAARNLARCDLVVGVLGDPRSLRQAARREFRYDWLLGAKTPFLVYSRVPRAALVAHERA
jgi:Dolichyl-phosphate-mannose-protein mannosyltransferase